MPLAASSRGRGRTPEDLRQGGPDLRVLPQKLKDDRLQLLPAHQFPLPWGGRPWG